jgi:hypothetical protein
MLLYDVITIVLCMCILLCVCRAYDKNNTTNRRRHLYVHAWASELGSELRMLREHGWEIDSYTNEYRRDIRIPYMHKIHASRAV